ncbi:MAG: DUF1963 domain-containing protein [Oscillospiraceae bacterium]|nr:DUF1963 domain-containing protein [Oscillospiraceae bacterium]
MNEEIYNKEYYTKEIQKMLDEMKANTSISIVFHEEECKTIPIGTTKLGGLPDLPPSVDYPECEAYSIFPNIKLPLVCQINCEELAPFLESESRVPKKGIIYIFWNDEDPGYAMKQYGIHALRVYYWDGNTSNLVRKQADEKTKIRPEKKVTFSKYEEVSVERFKQRIWELFDELSSECKNLRISYYNTETYNILDSIKNASDISYSTKLFGFRAGFAYYRDKYYNSFLQLYEQVKEGFLGCSYIAYIDVIFKDNMTGWTELSASIDYDAD